MLLFRAVPVTQLQFHRAFCLIPRCPRKRSTLNEKDLSVTKLIHVFKILFLNQAERCP